MNFDINDARHPSQFFLLKENYTQAVRHKIIKARADVLQGRSIDVPEILRITHMALEELDLLAASYTNLYDIARKAISENQFLLSTLNDNPASET